MSKTEHLYLTWSFDNAKHKLKITSLKIKTFTALEIRNRAIKSNRITCFYWVSSEASSGVATICLAYQHAG